MGNKEATTQLGMSHGHASSRLKKQLLFSYIQRCGDDICYRCKQPIDSIEKFSIDHIEPWFRNDTALFWDLNNIAFSHLSCNIAEGNQRRKSIIVSPVGQSWCGRCKQHLPIEKFNKGRRYNGLGPVCSDCNKILLKNYRNKGREAAGDAA